MAFSSKLGELFIDLVARGGGDVEKALDGVRSRLVQTDQVAGQTKNRMQEYFATQAQAAQADSRAAFVSAQAHLRFLNSTRGRAFLQGQAGTEASLDVSRQQADVLAAQARAQFVSTPAGMRTLGQEAGLNRQLDQARNIESYRRLVAENGRFGAGLLITQDRLQRISYVLRDMGHLGPAAFGWAGGLSGLVASASPEAFSTLTGSIRLLAAVIGRELVPWVVRASAMLQSWSRSYRELPPAVREGVAALALFGAGITGVLFVGGQLITFINGMITAYTALRTAVLGAAAAQQVMAASNVTAAATGAAAAGTAATVGRGAAGGGVAGALFNPITAAIAAIAVAGEQAWEGVSRARREGMGRGPGSDANRPWHWHLGNVLPYSAPGALYSGGHMLHGMMTGNRAPSPFEASLERWTGFSPRPSNQAPAAGPPRMGDQRVGGALNEASRVQPPRDFMLGFNFQAQFNSIEDFGRRVQLSIAGQSELDREIQRLQTEMLQAMLDNNGVLRDIRANTQNGPGMGR